MTSSQRSCTVAVDSWSYKTFFHYTLWIQPGICWLGKGTLQLPTLNCKKTRQRVKHSVYYLALPVSARYKKKLTADWKSSYVAEGNVTRRCGSGRPRQNKKVWHTSCLFNKKASFFIRPSFTAAMERACFSMDCAWKITGETDAQLSACFLSETDGSVSYGKTFAVLHGEIGLAASRLETGGLHR